MTKQISFLTCLFLIITIHLNASVSINPSAPSAEICNNGIDDDLDGLIDMHDPDCSSYVNSCSDGYVLETIGVGVHGTTNTTVQIPNYQNVDYIIAEAAYKHGRTRTMSVSMSTINETYININAVEHSSGNSIITNGYYRQVFSGAPSINLVLGGSAKGNVYSLVLHIYRKNGSASNSTTIANFIGYVYRNETNGSLIERSTSVQLPASPRNKNIQITLPLSELNNNNSRVAVIKATMGGVSVEKHIYGYTSTHSSLNLVDLELLNVPAGATTLTITARSPSTKETPSNGDAFLAGSAAISITNVCGLALPLVANSDTLTISEDSVLTLSSPGILANDIFQLADSVQIISHSNPRNGTINLDAFGALTYVPNANFYGEDSISYTIRNKYGKLSTAQIVFIVTSVQDAPEANTDMYSTNEDVSLLINNPIMGVLSNDTDMDGDSIFVTPGNYTSQNGTLILNNNGTFEYAPGINFNGVDSFMYFINDGNGNVCQASLMVSVMAMPDSVCVEPKVLLEGALSRPFAPHYAVAPFDFDVVPLTMQTDLITGNCGVVLPKHNPFQFSPDYQFTSTDSIDMYANSNFVDWILVSFRNGIREQNTIHKQAVVLNSDASITTSDGNRCINIPISQGDSIYTVIESLSHMGAMSNSSMALTEASFLPVLVDFRFAEAFAENLNNNSYGFQVSGQEIVGTQNGLSVYALTVGDFNKDYTIDANDVSSMQRNVGLVGGYNHVDVNLDCDVNGFDFNLMLNSLGKFSTVNAF